MIEERKRDRDPETGDEARAEGRSVRVTDKRMFTPDGRLREEYRFLEEPGKRPTGAAATPSAPPPLEPPAPAAPEPMTQGPATGEQGGAPPLELPPTSGPAGGPTFFHLVSVLAESAAMYLEGGAFPGDPAQGLEMARLHIDLLDVLRRKTVGNLSSQEHAVLEDALYRLRMRYLQKRG